MTELPTGVVRKNNHNLEPGEGLATGMARIGLISPGGVSPREVVDSGVTPAGIPYVDRRSITPESLEEDSEVIHGNNDDKDRKAVKDTLFGDDDSDSLIRERLLERKITQLEQDVRRLEQDLRRLERDLRMAEHRPEVASPHLRAFFSTCEDPQSFA